MSAGTHRTSTDQPGARRRRRPRPRHRAAAGLAGAALVAALLGAVPTAAGAQPTSAAATVLAVAQAPASAPRSSPTSSPANRSSVAWRDCGDGFQCATVQVPLDHDRPGGRQIHLALTRLPAADPAHRIGSLFVNPGGPGGSGVQFVRQGARLFYPPAVRDRFDVVGFDPRGVGASTPVQCFASNNEKQQFVQDYPRVPRTRQELRRAWAKVRELARRCQARAGWLLPHLSTADVARDLDLLRAKVGDRRLTYAGYSYGTYLGATYANLFPRRVRRLVLDAVIDAPAYTSGHQPSTNFVRQHSDQGSAETLDEFFRLCAQAGSRCAFGASGRPAAKYARLARRLREHPITTPDGAPFGYGELVSLTVDALYHPGDWDELGQLLQAVYAATSPERTFAAISQLRELGGQRAQAGAPVVVAPYDNFLEAGFASYCSETRNPRTLRGVRRAARAADHRSRYVGAYWAFVSLPCAAWPARAQDRYAGPWSARPSSPVLLLSTRFDPATPHRNAVTMDRLLPRTRLLTVDGWAHAALQTRSPCADGVVERYLVRGTLPGRGATCQTGVVPFAPVPSGRSRALPQPLPRGPLAAGVRFLGATGRPRLG